MNWRKGKHFGRALSTLKESRTLFTVLENPRDDIKTFSNSFFEESF